MRIRVSFGISALAIILSGWSSALRAADWVSIHGQVKSKDGPMEGAYIGAHAAAKTYTTYVMTDQSGQYTFHGLVPGNYTIATAIAGFRTAQKNGITVETGKAAVADFIVQPETDFQRLVEQATNSELLESFPLSQAQKQALDYRCSDCHGEYYIAKSRFTLHDWTLIVSKMDDRFITPAGDLSPPAPFKSTERRPLSAAPPGSDVESIAAALAQILGPQSPDFPIRFHARPAGKLTRAKVTEYQIPRVGAQPRYVAVDPRGEYVWYSDWRFNYIGRIEIKTGEIKEYSIPDREGRPHGLQATRWDRAGNLLVGQIWSGRAIRFDVKNEKITGNWEAPQEWARVGSVDICRYGEDGSASYWVSDALIGTSWVLDPETGKFTEVKAGARGRSTECDTSTDENPWHNGWSTAGGGKRVISYRNPTTGTMTDFPITVTPWARPYNAVGDSARNIGWTVPDVTNRIVKVNANTGEITEFPLPSRGKEIRNIDIELNSNPPALWFVNQRLGRVVRFQEY